MMTSLPVIDVSGLASPELSARLAVAAELGHACREIGFFYVVNHGIGDATRESMFAAAREFFALPVAAKEEYSIKRSQHNRGYVALEGERLNEAAAPADYKEAFNIGLELAADHPEVVAGKPFRGVNLWPALPHWREAVLAYYDACWALGRRIHHGFALDLGIAEDFFEDQLDSPLATLRMLHYPPRVQKMMPVMTPAPGCIPTMATLRFWPRMGLRDCRYAREVVRGSMLRTLRERSFATLAIA